ncbi:MAG: hypothetical protein ISR47_09970 [Rhodospirillales bacterium]|nr:hypothetical protein [Rhodospirillales bacterium]
MARLVAPINNLKNFRTERYSRPGDEIHQFALQCEKNMPIVANLTPKNSLAAPQRQFIRSRETTTVIKDTRNY